jgi:hypothetical protein
MRHGAWREARALLAHGCLAVLVIAAGAAHGQTPPGAADSKVQELLMEAKTTSPVQGSAQQPAPPPSEQAAREERAHELRMEQERNKRFFVPIVSLMAVLALVIVNYLLITRGNGTGPQVVNATALILIVFTTLLVVVIADTDQQLTAAVGILGAVAGYLFGSARRDSPAPEQQAPAGGQRG